MSLMSSLLVLLFDDEAYMLMIVSLMFPYVCMYVCMYICLLVHMNVHHDKNEEL